MSRWNGLLDAIFLPPRNWVLNEALKFTADLSEVEISRLARCEVKVKDTGEITVPAKYITDLASVPRLAWAIIAPFDVARAAVVHDIMYEKINGAFKNGEFTVMVSKNLIIMVTINTCSKLIIPNIM